ncbi:hypothetical protein X975_05883, partial [Stegodyphus mimosarum]
MNTKKPPLRAIRRESNINKSDRGKKKNSFTFSSSAEGIQDACSTRGAPRKTERSGGKSQHKSLTMVELMLLRRVRHENVTHVGAVRHFYYRPP